MQLLLAVSKEIKSRVYMNFILLYMSIFRILLYAYCMFSVGPLLAPLLTVILQPVLLTMSGYFSRVGLSYTIKTAFRRSGLTEDLWATVFDSPYLLNGLWLEILQEPLTALPRFLNHLKNLLQYLYVWLLLLQRPSGESIAENDSSSMLVSISKRLIQIRLQRVLSMQSLRRIV